MGFFSRMAIGAVAGGAINYAMTGNVGTGAIIGAGVGVTTGLTGTAAKIATGIGQTGIKGTKVGWKAAKWAVKNPATAGFAGLGAYGAYSLATGGPDTSGYTKGDEAREAFAMSRGSSGGTVSPVFEGSAEGLVQGLSRGRHGG